MFRLFLLFSVLLNFFNCENSTENTPTASHQISQEFRDYWYAGKAELNSYQLQQSRYGEIHQGQAVLIFVTEDFLTEKQVKYEGGDMDEDINSVLKLNFIRKFNTGIYPYSIMSSIFTAIDPPSKTYKVTTSTQEWCGHTFSQINNNDGDLQVQSFSYFMDEGDQNVTLDVALLEDSIWNMIRLNHDNLPQGNIRIVPGTQFVRLNHRPLQIEEAEANMSIVSDSIGGSLKRYVIDYKDFNRRLSIDFRLDFPYEIISWEETVDAGFGQEGSLTTKATRTNYIKEPYWKLNSVKDSIYRKKLGLGE